LSIYEAAAPYGGTCEKAITGTPVSVNGEDVFTTKADGTVKIAGLFVSDSVNDAKSSLTRCYVLKEIEAPAGFITPQGDDALRAVKVTVGTSAVSTYELVENTQQGVPELPLTGANGQMLMIIGGSAVLLISAGLVMVNRRRGAAQRNGS
ncbi:MAG: SpaH/EbpB family LPXTG-anchored major pilin, partial [Micrococcaceae bacterium]|nr:SpaH/EbpB family LPXTG-anchored major pilin [Micrococcaceae bacterium]